MEASSSGVRSVRKLSAPESRFRPNRAALVEDSVAMVFSFDWLEFGTGIMMVSRRLCLYCMISLAVNRRAICPPVQLEWLN
jgi:hypothetical protein